MMTTTWYTLKMKEMRMLFGFLWRFINVSVILEETNFEDLDSAEHTASPLSHYTLFITF